MYRLKCSEIRGGNKEADTEVSAGSLTASLFSSSADGGKGGDIYYLGVCGQETITRIAVADVVGHGKVVSELHKKKELFAMIAGNPGQPVTLFYGARERKFNNAVALREYLIKKRSLQKLKSK